MLVSALPTALLALACMGFVPASFTSLVGYSLCSVTARVESDLGCSMALFLDECI